MGDAIRDTPIVDYDLSRLGNREFEHLVQALMRSELGGSLQIFGDGPDGGREAVWDGEVPSLGGAVPWAGYGVVQAKARREVRDVASNLKWINTQVNRELKEWAESPKRIRYPDHLLFVTNVRLSSVPGHGIDAANENAETTIRSHRLPITNVRIIHLDDIRVLLDKHHGIRRAYAAWITPGDVLARLLDEQDSDDRDFKNALLAHAGQGLIDENRLNLTQAGSASESANSVPEVFTDLPVRIDTSRVDAVFFESEQSDLTGVVPLLIEKFDSPVSHDQSPAEGHNSRRAVLIGGPGQGKTTVTQYLAQVYRAAFLDETPTSKGGEVGGAIRLVKDSLRRLNLAGPSARRWPVRIVMTKLADALSSGEASSLVEYISQLISARSSSEITTRRMRRWLEEYPWLLLIDGLDEVPESSNREQVLRAIRDFFIEVSTVEADVVAICTTRPQGYSSEFDPQLYVHYELAPLAADESVRFADSFIALRNGAQSERTQELQKKLRTAAATESTARLMSSPLQVTIMVMLIERLGQAPKDRWKLFSQYYRVIFQREQEKPGELAEMLRTYEQDVDAIHRTIGYRLQRRSAEAGGTSSSLARNELEDAIEERLRSQGYEADAALELRSKFSTLVTDRLVFLAFLTSDSIGFEIRSLQEFMAGEYIVHLDYEQMRSILTDVAREAHWDNAVLFAMGKIFADRENLRDSVLVICESLDLQGLPEVKPNVGADLALKLLLDGTCVTQPRYSRLLYARALGLLDGPFNPDVAGLSSLALSSNQLKANLVSRLQETNQSDASSLFNRLVCWDVLADAEPESSAFAIESLVTVLGQIYLGELLTIAHSRPYGPLFRYLEDAASGLAPTDLVSAVLNPDVRDSRARKGGRKNWFAAVTRVIRTARTPVSARQFPLRFGSDLTMVQVASVHDEAGNRRWSDLLEYPAPTKSWDAFLCVASFAAAPRASTLAASLRAFQFQDYGWFSYVSHLVPWPLRAVLETVERHLSLRSQDSSVLAEILLRFAEMADSGELGDIDEWARAEARWFEEGYSVLEDDSLPILAIRRDGASVYSPVWTGIGEAGFIHDGFDVSQSMSREGGELIATIEALFDSVHCSPERGGINSLSDLGFFLLSSLVWTLQAGIDEDEAAEAGGGPGSDPVHGDLARRMAGMIGQMSPVRTHVDWLSLLSEQEFEHLVSSSLLDSFGRRGLISTSSIPRTAALCLEAWYSCPANWGLLNIAFVLDSRETVRFLRAKSDVPVESGVPEHFASLIRVSRATVETVRSGDVDAQLLELVGWSRSVRLGGMLGSRPVWTVIRALPPDLQVVLRLRIASLTLSTSPLTCEFALLGLE